MDRRSVRTCLKKSMKIVNFIMLLFGIGILIYSLWMEKQWHHCISYFIPHPSPPPPIPWFIYACLGVGIAVSLSTLCGYMALHSAGHYTLFAYIFIICFLPLLEVAVVIIIFFKMDSIAQISSSIDKEHKEEFKSFLNIYLRISRVVVILTLATQINGAALAVIVWLIGTEPRIECNQPNVSRFSYSFLVPNVPEIDSSIQACSCRRCEDLLLQENPQPAFLFNIFSVIRDRFRRD